MADGHFEAKVERRSENAKAKIDRRTVRPRSSVAERFWPKVDRSGGDAACWSWTANRDKRGYGTISGHERNTTLIATRVSFELAHGSIPDGLFVLHRCDNPACVNPTHLFLGTQADNIRDMVAKGRARRSALADEQIRSIRASAETQLVIARKYGISRPLVSMIKNRRVAGNVE